MRLSKFLIIIFIIIIIHFILKIFLDETSEDKFHKLIHNNLNSLDDSPIVKFKFKNKKEYLKIKKNICKSRLFEKHYKEIEKFKPNFVLNDDKILKNKSNIARINFDKKNLIFNFTFNHFFLGADSFLKLKSLVFNDEPIKIPSSSYKNGIFIFRFLHDIYNFLRSRDFTSLNRIDYPRRLCSNHIFDNNDFLNIKKRNFILYFVMKKMYKCLNLNRPMRVIVPVPFQRFNKINNNLGAIFILFNGDETLEQFSNYFDSRRYMCMASNFLLISKINKLFTNNSDIRKKIDMIVTSIYSTSTVEYSMNWTTKILPIESVYVAAYTRINNNNLITNITYTISTSNFVKDSDMKKYKIN